MMHSPKVETFCGIPSASVASMCPLEMPGKHPGDTQVFSAELINKTHWVTDWADSTGSLSKETKAGQPNSESNLRER
jgi:hypothetical protein